MQRWSCMSSTHAINYYALLQLQEIYYLRNLGSRKHYRNDLHRHKDKYRYKVGIYLALAKSICLSSCIHYFSSIQSFPDITTNFYIEFEITLEFICLQRKTRGKRYIFTYIADVPVWKENATKANAKLLHENLKFFHEESKKFPNYYQF